MEFFITFCSSFQRFCEILQLTIKGSKRTKHQTIFCEKGVPVLIRYMNAFFVFIVIFLFFFMGIVKGEDAMPVRVGDPAPDFQVKDDAGRMRTLSEFRGKKVVLYFYPIILLSDEKKEVAEAYGASGGLLGSLMAKRYTYLIDEHGKIVHIFKKVDVKNHAAEVLQAFSEHSKK